MNIFISGGCKNGKSYHAQGLARKMAKEQGIPLYYLATMIPYDEEDRARIKRHLSEREGWGFATIEQGIDICQCLTGMTTEGEAVNPNGVFLLDSVTALLQNEMFEVSGRINETAAQKVSEDLICFAKMTGNTVFVSDYIYSDSRTFEESTENYRKGLARVDRRLAEVCDQVVEVSYGFKHLYK